jgi:hypothetical protein
VDLRRSPTIYPKDGAVTVPNKYDAIKGYTQNVLTNGDVDEKKTYHKFLGEQFDFTKDEDKVELREENEKLRTVLSAVGTIATVMSQRWLSEQQAS